MSYQQLSLDLVMLLVSIAPPRVGLVGYEAQWLQTTGAAWSGSPPVAGPLLAATRSPAHSLPQCC
eukprot:6201465-Pleurochrysis_carterae.AAC.8